MNDWEIRHLQNNLERLEQRVAILSADQRKESLNKFIWLTIISNILFWFCFYHIVLKRDVNKIETEINSMRIMNANPIHKIKS